MTTSPSVSIVPILVAASFIALVLGSSAPQPLHPTVDMAVTKPENVGFSSERPERLHTLMQNAVGIGYQTMRPGFGYE